MTVRQGFVQALTFSRARGTTETTVETATAIEIEETVIVVETATEIESDEEAGRRPIDREEITTIRTHRAETTARERGKNDTTVDARTEIGTAIEVLDAETIDVTIDETETCLMIAGIIVVVKEKMTEEQEKTEMSLLLRREVQKPTVLHRRNASLLLT